MKNKFIMLVGLPASGKSTLAEQCKKSYENSIILSSDELRKELFNDENNQDNNGILFKEMNKRTKQFLKEGKTVIYDATNINQKRRITLLNNFKKIDCIKECKYLVTPYNKCLENDNNRERKVGKQVIDKMRSSLFIPSYMEGWDNLYVELNCSGGDFSRISLKDKLSYNDYIKILNKSELLNKSIEMPQDNPHHTFSLSRHMYKAYEYIKKTYPNNEKVLIASLFHDVGKAECKTFKEDGYAHYYGHENISAQITFEFLTRFCEELSFDDIFYICNLIQLHMRYYNFEGLDKLRKLVGKEIFEDLRILHEADSKAK